MLDPFFGSGTAGLVAKQTGWRYIGIEIMPNIAALPVNGLEVMNISNELKPRNKRVQKMTRNGAIEENRTTGEIERISKRDTAPTKPVVTPQPEPDPQPTTPVEPEPEKEKGSAGGGAFDYFKS